MQLTEQEGPLNGWPSSAHAVAGGPEEKRRFLEAKMGLEQPAHDRPHRRWGE